MTARTRLARMSPVWTYAVRKSHEAARLASEVRQMEHDLAVVRAELSVANIDRDALRAHLELANTQRDRARDLAGALMGEEHEFSAGDLAWLDEHGVGAE